MKIKELEEEDAMVGEEDDKEVLLRGKKSRKRRRWDGKNGKKTQKVQKKT